MGARRRVAAWAISISVGLLVVACGGGESHQQLTTKQAESKADIAESSVMPTVGAQFDLALRKRDVDAYMPAIVSKDKLPVLSPAVQRKATVFLGLPGVPRQIGVVRGINLGKSTDLIWTRKPTGEFIFAQQFTSEGAVGLRIGVLVEQLPDLAVVRIYVPGASTEYAFGGLEINQIVARNRAAGDSDMEARTWWSPYVDGTTAVLEVQLPQGLDPAVVKVAVPRISHIFTSPRDVVENKLSPGSSESCNLDVNCYSTYQSHRNSVGHIIYTKNGSSYQCTGTLLNDMGESHVPYFLTANHCIDTQSAASSVQTYWFGESAGCNLSALSPSYTSRTGGSLLLYSSSATDTAFLRLLDSPPGGVTFAGWYGGLVNIGDNAFGIHHPRGDMKKISFGSVRQFCNVTGSTSNCGPSSSGAKYSEIQFTQGTTEPGSSGSAAWVTIAGTPRVVGQLLGGNSSCTNLTGSNIYGRFDLAYEAGIKTFLGSGTTVPSGGSIPQTGWWWNSNESGRGFALEVRGTSIFLAGFMYADSGRDAWYAASLARTSSGSYSGSLYSYSGGQDRVQTQGARGPTANSAIASVELFASSPTNATLRVTQGGVAKDITLTRLPISSPAFAASTAAFQSGWWWNPNESGHGYFIEAQGNTLFSAIYTYYGSSGESGWYVNGANLGSAAGFSGTTYYYRNGQTLMGEYVVPVGPTYNVIMSFIATSATTGVITFSNGVSVNVQRFVF